MVRKMSIYFRFGTRNNEMKRGLLQENIRIALTAIKAQLSRAIITALIISFGIMALVGILTATDAIQQSITGEFSALGATTFSISNRERGIFIGRRGTKPKQNPAITFEQAKRFKQRFSHDGSLVSISYMASGTVEAKYKSEKTDPNTQVWAIDENFLTTNGLLIAEGRSFTKFDNDEADPHNPPACEYILYECILGQCRSSRFYSQAGGLWGPASSLSNFQTRNWN